MKVIITEKPSVARKIAYFLFGNSVRPIKIGKLTVYQAKDYVVVPAIGHIFTLTIKGQGLPVFEYDWTLRNDPYCRALVKYLKSIKPRVEEVIIATDYDIEGELIGYNIVRFCLGKVKTKRMKFSEITKQAIKNAFEHPIDVDHNLVKAGETRHILDLLYGINFSRYIQKEFKKYYLSAGRVQTPLLKIIYQREKEIENFVPKNYYRLLLETEKFKVFYKKTFETLDQAKEAKKKGSNECLVKDLETVEEKLYPRPPFNLTKLQEEAWRLYKIKPEDTLRIAQRLYEAGYISYPRTSSEKYPKNLNFKQIFEKLSVFNEYKPYVNNIFERWPVRPVEGKKDDPAHPCIYPTGYLPKKMTKKEFYIYSLVVKRFLCTFLEPAILLQTKAKIVSGELVFELSFKKIKTPSWLDLYPITIETTDLDLKPGLRLPCKLRIKKEKTKPPSRYNPASLVKYMETINIGTKSTRAMMVEKLFKRGYITGSRTVKITDLGKRVIELLDKKFPKITSIDLTREMEEELEKIESGKGSGEEVVTKAKSLIKESIQGKE